MPESPSSAAGVLEGTRDRRAGSGAEPGTNPVQAVGTGLGGVSQRVQRATQHVFQFGRPGLAVSHDSRSSAGRSAAMARDACLLTARVLIPMAAAIWASDRSQ